MSSQQKSRFDAHPLLTSTAITLFLLVLFIIAFETIARFTSYNKMLEMQKHALSIYQLDQENGFDLKKNLPSTVHVFSEMQYEIFTNSLGCFDNKYDKQSKEPYILLVGDSFTWGYTPFANKWGNIVEKQLNKRTLKCGVSNYGSKQQFNKARKVVNSIGKTPELLIVAYYIRNDAHDDFIRPNATVINGYSIDTIKSIDHKTGDISRFSDNELQQKYKKKRKLVKVWLKTHSILYNLVSISTRRLKTMRKDKLNKLTNTTELSYLYQKLNEDHWWRKHWQQHLTTLVSFKKLTDQWGSKLLVVIIPEKFQVYPYLTKTHGENFDLTKPNREIIYALKTANIDYLDLLPHFQKVADKTQKTRLNPTTDYYWNEDQHWNIQGNKFAGKVISQYLKNYNLPIKTDKNN